MSFQKHLVVPMYRPHMQELYIPAGFILDAWGQEVIYETLLWFTIFQYYGDKWMEKRIHSKVKERLYFSSANMKLLIILNMI